MEATSTAAKVLQQPSQPVQLTTPEAASRNPLARFYLPQLDAVRFFAFLVVFLLHASPHEMAAYVKMGAPPALAKFLTAICVSGAYGVDLFFVLSSYLITTLLLRELKAEGKVRVWRFYLRRTLRIWPLYFLFLGIYFFFQGRIPGLHLKSAELVPFLYFFGNFAVILNPLIPIAHLWSVSVEEQFYLAWAFVLRWTRPNMLPVLATVAIVLSQGTRLIMFYRHAPFTFFWCNTLTRLDPLAMGVLLASATIFSKPLRARWFWLLGACGMVLVDEIVLPMEHRNAVSITLGYFIVALCCTIVVKAALGMHLGTGIVARTLAYLGKISYGLYVWHPLSIQFVESWFPGQQVRQYLLRASVSFGMTILVSVLSYECYEKWFVKLKNRFTYIKSRPA